MLLIERLVAMLRGWGWGRSVNVLIEQLKDMDPAVRAKTAIALGDRGPRAVVAIPALIEALRDREELVSERASGALARIGPVAVPALIEALEDQNTAVREMATEALGR